MTQQKKSVLEQYPDFEAVIGIEVHVQLKTASKIFCACPNRFGDQPNHNICPVCTGFLGTLPRVNRRVIDDAIMLGCATNCSITRRSEFARKHYTYPDLPKNYQISQDDKPICTEGYVAIESEDGAPKKIRLIRIHMEEDAGKNIHSTGYDATLVDLNRAGTPLLEVVSYPDISTAEEARAYLQRLRATVQYLGISDADMEKGSFRGDINISVRKRGAEKLGTKVELKNLNSFRYIVRAIEYEIERQIKALLKGDVIHQETRQWDQKEEKTLFMRRKEVADDYRYYPDPDLPLLIIDDLWIERIKAQIPELPAAKCARFKTLYGLSTYEAELLTIERPLADFFEAVVALCQVPKTASNWILRDLLAYMNEHKLGLNELKVTPALLAEFVTAVDKGMINSRVAQEVFAEMAATGASPLGIIKAKGLEQIDSDEELAKIAQAVVTANPSQVATFKAGNERIFSFFVGQAMKACGGKANPQKLQDAIKKALK